MPDQPRNILCPYCGLTQTIAKQCDHCGGLFEPLSRLATQIEMGPWFIRDETRPFLPGCSYEALVRKINTGQILPTTILRGPTTRQFWGMAKNVKNVAHLLGFCHLCNEKVPPTDRKCPHCTETFNTSSQRDRLGLLYSTTKQLAAARAGLRKKQQQAAQPGTNAEHKTKPNPTTLESLNQPEHAPLDPADALDAARRTAQPSNPTTSLSNIFNAPQPPQTQSQNPPLTNQQTATNPSPQIMSSSAILTHTHDHHTFQRTSSLLMAWIIATSALLGTLTFIWYSVQP